METRGHEKDSLKQNANYSPCWDTDNTYSEKTRHLGNTQRKIIAPLLGEGKHKPFAQCSVHASTNMHINFTVRIIVPFGTKDLKGNAQKDIQFKTYDYECVRWPQLSNLRAIIVVEPI
jgi:hypothetical protein